MSDLPRPDVAVTLRRATPSDAPALSTLAARLFEQTYEAANRPDDMRDYLAAAFSADAQRNELAHAERVVWIAEDATAAPIGYAALRRGSAASGVGGARPAEIERIYADRAWHGRGVGDTLMRACVEQARAWSCDVIWLGVWERNPRAIAFYGKNGFRVVGQQAFRLGRDVQNDIVMARGLG